MKPYYQDEWVTLYHGDFREVEWPTGVPLIFTDPPYPKQYLPLYSDLSELGSRILAPGGNLLAYSGHFAIPEVVRRLGERLSYWWCCCSYEPGPTRIMFGSGVAIGWKPIWWYRNPPLRPFSFAIPVYDSSEHRTPPKKVHPWEQTSQAATRYISRLSNPGDTIVEPFAGGGVFVVAARALGRHVVAAEIDERWCELIIQRLAAEHLFYGEGATWPQPTRNAERNGMPTLAITEPADV